MKHLAFVVLAFTLITGVPARAELPPPVARMLAEAGIPASAVGLLVAPVNAPQPGPRFIEHGSTRGLQPGSTMKLLTTLVALEQLGPTWRGHTRLLAAGAVRDGVLHGDLVLQGGADADLGWQALHELLKHARDRGLREVRGQLRLDRTAFNPPRSDVGVPPFDESPEADYNVIPDALLVNGNLLRLELFTDERGLQIVATPPLAGVRVTHEMTLVQGDCTDWDAGWQTPLVRLPGPARSLDVVLRGSWPAGCERAVEVNVLERNEFIGRLVRRLWSGLGGTWRGGVVEGAAPADALLLAEHLSRPLSELVRAVNKPSDNTLSRILYLALGRAGEGSADEPTSVRAERAVRAWLQRQRIDGDGLVLDNGSGLSRRERISAAQLEAVLRAALASRWAPEFLASLPIAGLDGTLRRRLVNSPAAGRARLKTGTLGNAVALAGLMPDASGQPCIVVVMINHERAQGRVARPIADAFIDWVARTRFTPPAAAVR